MSLPRGLVFSVATTIANLTAIYVGAFVTTAWTDGLSKELVVQVLAIPGKMVSIGGLIVVAIFLAMTFCAWLMIQRAGSSSGRVRIALIGAAILAASLLPLGLGLTVFGHPLTAIVTVGVPTGLAVAIAARDRSRAGTSRPLAPGQASTRERTGFGRRGG